MERYKEIEEHLEEYCKHRIDLKRLFLSENIMQLITSFQNKLDTLIMEQVQRDVKIKYIFACRLLSSTYTESYQWVLGMSNSMLYLDEGKSLAYWYPELIYKDVNIDMKEVEKNLRKKFIRLEDFELFNVQVKLLDDDGELLQDFLGMIFKQSLRLIINSDLQLENELLFLCGNYMDDLKIIWHAKGRGNNE